MPDTHREQRERDIKIAIRHMGKDDGDDLPSGKFKLNKDGHLTRTGDVKAIPNRYHGTSAKSDDNVIADFKPYPLRGTGSFVPRKALDKTPAVYATSDKDAAEEYALGITKEAKGKEPHLYNLVAVPSETVDLGDCQDVSVMKDTIARGADVIECPDYWEQPETVVLDPRILHVREAVNVDSGKKLDVPPKRGRRVYGNLIEPKGAKMGPKPSKKPRGNRQR